MPEVDIKFERRAMEIIQDHGLICDHTINHQPSGGMLLSLNISKVSLDIEEPNLAYSFEFDFSGSTEDFWEGVVNMLEVAYAIGEI